MTSTTGKPSSSPIPTRRLPSIGTAFIGNRPSFKARKQSQKRVDLRNRLWPDLAEWIWDRRKSKGFATIPRTLPLLILLINKLAGKIAGNPGKAYLDLWSRNFDEGILSNIDPLDFAYSSGYESTRGARTWRDHINKLDELGFIKVKREGNKEVGHILLLDPYKVVAKLRKETNRVPDEWWTAFIAYSNRIGATVEGEKSDL